MAITGIGGYNSISNRSVSSSSFNIPEIPDSMTSKGQSKLSEGEIKDKLLEMARKNTASREYSGNPYRSNSSEWLKLEKDYVSFASPNRNSIINNTLSGLGKKLSMMMPRLNLSNNLLGLLMQHNRLFRSKDTGDNFINFKDACGNLVATYSQLPNGCIC